MYWLSLLLIVTLFQGFFSRFTDFLFSQKSTSPNSIFDQDEAPAWKPAQADLASFINVVIYLIFSYFFLQDIHPFYADLMNVLYDKDHYKLALGQINTARHLIDK